MYTANETTNSQCKQGPYTTKSMVASTWSERIVCGCWAPDGGYGRATSRLWLWLWLWPLWLCNLQAVSVAVAMAVAELALHARMLGDHDLQPTTYNKATNTWTASAK